MVVTFPHIVSERFTKSSTFLNTLTKVYQCIQDIPQIENLSQEQKEFLINKEITLFYKTISKDPCSEATKKMLLKKFPTINFSRLSESLPGSRTAQIRQNEIPPQRRKRKIPEPKAKREVPPPEQHINGAKNSGNKVGSFPHRKKRRVNSPMATPQTQTSPTLPLSQPGSLPSLKQLRLDEYLHLPIPTPNDSN